MFRHISHGVDRPPYPHATPSCARLNRTFCTTSLCNSLYTNAFKNVVYTGGGKFTGGLFLSYSHKQKRLECHEREVYVTKNPPPKLPQNSVHVFLCRTCFPLVLVFASNGRWVRWYAEDQKRSDNITCASSLESAFIRRQKLKSDLAAEQSLNVPYR